MINMGELFRYERIGDADMARVTLSPDLLARSLVESGDLLFARRSLQLSGAGRCSIVVPAREPRTFESSIIRVRLDLARAVPEFFYYFFKSRAGRETMNTIVEQAVVAGIRASDLRMLSVPVPALEEQRGIVSALAALDDKIESNRRAIALVQNLIRATFDQWRNRFPVERIVTFGEFADVYGGATPKTGVRNFWEGDIAWATPTDITALSAPYLFGTARTLSEAGLASTSAKLHPVGTILMTSRATIGAFAVNEVPTATNQGFIAVRPRDPGHRWFLLEEMRSRVPEMLDRANGSTFMELSRGNFKTMSIGLPAESGLAELHSLLGPLHARSSQLDRECSKLANFRDALLPELLSGRVRVPESEEVLA